MFVLVDERCSMKEELVPRIALEVFAGWLLAVATWRCLEALLTFLSDFRLISGAMMRLWIGRIIQEKVLCSSQQQF
jgi:hypothetical protein